MFRRMLTCCAVLFTIPGIAWAAACPDYEYAELQDMTLAQLRDEEVQVMLEQMNTDPWHRNAKAEAECRDSLRKIREVKAKKQPPETAVQ